MKKPQIWKYCYWIEPGRLETLKQHMAQQGIDMPAAQKNPCEALLGEAGCVGPEVWSVICGYDAAPWYHRSRFAGKTLVVSTDPLGPDDASFLETTIAPVDFKPPRMPTPQEKQALTEDPRFLAAKPPAWDAFPAEMGERIAQGLSKLTGNPPQPWSDIFRDWTAVHANFASPRFRADGSLLQAPYSVGHSYSISSCCVELFNLLESKEKALLVRPCTGALMVNALEKDRYYLVRLVKN